MQFGVFNLMGFRDPNLTTKEILQDAVDLVRIADDGGLAAAWFAEHHFSNYCVCPSPLTMAAYCAPITKRIRLATGVLVLPLYQPMRLLAEIGMVDSLSEGRLELGVGAGYQPYEFERFGLDLSQSIERTGEILVMIEEAFAKPFFEHRGGIFNVSRTHIPARPHGRPPRIWIAGDAPPLMKLAAKMNFGLIQNGRFGDADSVAVKRTQTEKIFADAGGNVDQLRYSLLRFCCVSENKTDVLEYAENARYQMRLAYGLRRREEVLEGTMLREEPNPNDPPSLEAIAQSQMIGSVEECIERGIEEIRKARPVHTALYFSLGSFRGQRARRSLELFIDKVVPGIEKELGPLADIPGTRDTRISGQRVAAE